LKLRVEKEHNGVRDPAQISQLAANEVGPP
jgi:hypothetical protein